jgi:hypothetical protein
MLGPERQVVSADHLFGRLLLSCAAKIGRLILAPMPHAQLYDLTLAKPYKYWYFEERISIDSTSFTPHYSSRNPPNLT